MKNYFPILFSLSFILIACSKENTTCPIIDEKVEVQFDLQTGFGDNAVSIKIDDEYYFHAMLTGIELLAGPQASFTTYLLQGEHNLNIQRNHIDNYFGNAKLDSTVIFIGTAEKYWIGLSVYSDSLYISIQDSRFFYI